MDYHIDDFPTIDDITTDDDREWERRYSAQLDAANDYAAWIEQQALLAAEERDHDGDWFGDAA